MKDGRIDFLEGNPLGGDSWPNDESLGVIHPENMQR